MRIKVLAFAASLIDRTRRLLRLVLSICVLLAVSSTCPAQSVTNATNTGTPENAVVHGSDIENVQVNNGNLHVDIPIWAAKGRGLDTSAHFVSDTKGWTFTTTCDPVSGDCTDQIREAQSPIPNGMVLGAVNSLSYNWSDVRSSFLCQTVNYTLNSLTLLEPNGTKHGFLPNPFTTSANQCYPTPTTLYAGDGSGWTATPGPSNSWIFTNKHGTTVNLLGTAPVEDTNGNELLSTNSTDTLGRAIGTTTYNDSNGTARSFVTATTTVPVHTNICAAVQAITGSRYCNERIVTWTVPSQITLPDNQSYTFTYEQNAGGELASITLPSGAQISYTYGTSDEGGRDVASRTLTVNGVSSTWNYSYVVGASATVTDPANNDTVYTCLSDSHVPAPAPCYISSVKSYQGSHTSGTLLKTVTTDYQFYSIGSGTFYGATYIVLPIRETTTWNQQNLVRKAETDWDTVTYGSNTITWQNPVERREYDWATGAPGALLRRTHYNYLHLQNSTYLNKNIADRATDVAVYDSTSNTCQGVSNPCSETITAYDGSALTSTSGAPNHDYTNFSATNLVRGNPTTITRKCFQSCSDAVTTYTYNDLGNILTTVDPSNHTTTFDYTDNWANASCVPGGVQTHGYITITSNALNQAIKTSYYPCTGLTASQQNQNDLNASRPGTTFQHDYFGRLTQRKLPDSGETDIVYNDVPPVSNTTTTKINSTQSVVTTKVFDGLNRLTQTQLADPQGTVFVDTAYDLLGRVSTVSNPHRTSGSPTDGTTTYNYDALSRKIKEIPPDGSISANNISTTYTGNITQVTDQTGRTRKSYADGLGRLFEVDEPGFVPGNPGSGSATVSGSEQSVGTPGTAGTGSVTITGHEQSVVQCSGAQPAQSQSATPQVTCPTIYDTGSVYITVNGFTKAGSFLKGSTNSTVASALATAFNGDSSSPVTATASAAVVTLTAKATGSTTNYSLSTSVDWDSADFTSPSFKGTPSGSTLTGGTNGSTTYDSGTVSVTVNGIQASTSYGQGDTATTVAQRLQSNMGSMPVNVSLSGSALILTAKTSGSATNYSLSASSSTNQPSKFSQPSFTMAVSGSALTGGTDPTFSISSPAVTLYTFDALGDLTNVVQKGNTTNSSQWRPRTFTYDSLSRLLTSSNPEAGTITYSYNPDSTVFSKKDARNITTTYTYDAIQRERSRTYSNGDPTVSITYDETNCLGLPHCDNVGHRTSSTDAAGSEIWSYDVPDRIHKEQRTTSAITKTTTYNFDYAGDLSSVVYPTGRTVNYTYDSAKRPSVATDASNGITYGLGTCANGIGSNGVCYAPQGSVSSMTIGQASAFAGLNFTSTYNNRLQPGEIKATSTGGNAIDITYSFVDPATQGNAGHVMSISNNLNSNRSQVFAYDPLNRLISAGTTATSGNYCWGYVYTYDAWGNLTAQAGSSGYPGCTQYLAPASTATGNNQLSGFTYDPSGNTLSDGVYSYTWDGESQMKTAAGVTYAYDGDGRRVSKSTGKLYWYGSGGEILAETDGSGNTQNEYIFFGGKRVAVLPAGSAPLYYVEDMLGSSRVITTSTGVVCYDADFYPYGGEAAYTNSCAQSYKFEGKERDSETQNDEFGARSYSWRFGRWLSADWSNVPAPVPYANLTNPQTLNLYAMVADDPESFADLDGHYFNTGLSQSESAHSQDACAQGILSACNADQSTAMIREAEAQAAQAQNQAQSQNPAQQQHSISGFFSRIFHRHHVRFEGNSVERSILKDNWNKLMQSNNARALAKIALKKGDLTIRTTDGDSFSRKSDNSINVNIFSNPPVTTTEGVENYTLTYIVMGHELGHRAGYNDDGPNRMNNINHSENPIRRDFGLPERTEY